MLGQEEVIYLSWIDLCEFSKLVNALLSFLRVQLANLHVMELLFVATPDGVMESIVLSFNTKPLVRIIVMKRHADLSTKDALSESKPPKLKADMFGARLNHIVVNINGRAIKCLVMDINIGDFLYRRSEICV